MIVGNNKTYYITIFQVLFSGEFLRLPISFLMFQNAVNPFKFYTIVPHNKIFSQFVRMRL